MRECSNAFLLDCLPCAANVTGGMEKNENSLSAAEESETQYRSVLERLPVPLVIHDSDGRVVFLNTAFTHTFGYSKEDVPTLDEWWKRAYPDPAYLKRVLELRAHRDAALKAGQECDPIVVRVCCLDGSYRIVSVDSSLMAGSHSGLYSVSLTDITERTKSMKRIHDLEKALHLHSIVAVTDARGVIIDVNDKFCEISKYSRGELLGQTHRIVNSGYHDAAFFAEMWKTIAAGSVWTGVLRNRAKDGSFYWLDTTIVPIPGEDGKPESYIALRTDITALVSARDAAETASRTKSEFLAMMSHELRTPLNGIIGVLSLIENESVDPSILKRIAIARHSSDILLGLISNLLDYARLEAGKVSILQETVEIRTFLRHLLEIAKAASSTAVDFAIDVETSVPELVVMDRGKVSQVILNLLGNAVKFTKEGSITLSAWVDHHTRPDLVFEVSDTGIGFDEANLPRMFEPYGQVSREQSLQYGGAGLGLSISRQLVELMGGSITGRSQRSTGSAFFVSLPLVEPPRPGVQAVLSGAQISAKTGTILVAEDNELNLQIMGQMLQNLGCKMLRAENGRQALEVFSREPCDLIFMDLQMPEMDGMEAARRIRARSNRHVPIIAITADAWGQRRRECLAAGMDDFITKPVSLDQLREILTQYLN